MWVRSLYWATDLPSWAQGAQAQRPLRARGSSCPSMPAQTLCSHRTVSVQKSCLSRANQTAEALAPLIPEISRHYRWAWTCPQGMNDDHIPLLVPPYGIMPHERWRLVKEGRPFESQTRCGGGSPPDRLGEGNSDPLPSGYDEVVQAECDVEDQQAGSPVNRFASVTPGPTTSATDIHWAEGLGGLESVQVLNVCSPTRPFDALLLCALTTVRRHRRLSSRHW